MSSELLDACSPYWGRQIRTLSHIPTPTGRHSLTSHPSRHTLSHIPTISGRLDH